MKSLCRLCSLEDNTHNLHNVFSTKVRGSKDLLVDILYWTFSVEIDVTDDFPKAICTDCKILIEYVMEIKSAFHRNQEYLLRKYSAEPQVPITATVSAVKREEIPIEIVLSDDEEEEMYAEVENQSETVKVKVSDLEDMSPLVVIKPFETSEEYMWYKPVGFGQFIKRKYREFRFDDELLEDICGFMGTANKIDGHKKKCKVNGLKKNQSGSTLPSKNLTINTGPKVWLEPVEHLMVRENYKEISTFCYTKNPHVKSYRVLSLNHNFTDSMYKLSNMRKLWVCDYCSKSFLSQNSLKMHCCLKHKVQLSEMKQTYKKRDLRTLSNTETRRVNDSFSDEDLKNSDRKRSNSVSSPSSRRSSNDFFESEGGSNGTTPKVTYVWERKKLGVYKATEFCNIKSSVTNGLNSKQMDLDKTVRKLADRLDES